MSIKDFEISKLEDLDKLRTAPELNKNQIKQLLIQVESIVYKADWITIGVMSPSLEIGINVIRRIENKFKYHEMQCIDLPTSKGPIFLKANQKTGKIHARIEYGLGEGILISSHNQDTSLDAKTIGPFPLNFFNLEK